MVLRPYQEAGREALSSLLKQGKKRILLRAPCGAGKGTISASMVQRASERGKNSLFLVDRRVIVQDMSQRLDKLGVEHGIIMGDDPRRGHGLRTHVASIDTLYRRTDLPHADLIIIDECRGALSPKWQGVLARYPNSAIIGLDATPVRRDGRGLDELFEAMVELPNESQMVEMGFLVPCRVYGPTDVDTKGMGMVAGEYDQEEAAHRIESSKIIGDVVKHYRQYAAGRKAAYFCVNKDHARKVALEFRSAGIYAKAVLDDTPETERKEAWEELDYGPLQVVCGVGLFSYGWDHPIVSCVGDLQLTGSLSRHLQKMGRGARIFPGKVDMVHIDHVGNTRRHGFFDDPREWSLTSKKKRKVEKLESIRTCKACWCVFPATVDVCPACGAEYHTEKRGVEHEDGVLGEILPDCKCNGCGYTTRAVPKIICNRCYVGSMIRIYKIQKLSRVPAIAALQREAEAKGYKPGWVWTQMQRRRG